MKIEIHFCHSLRFYLLFSHIFQRPLPSPPPFAQLKHHFCMEIFSILKINVQHPCCVCERGGGHKKMRKREIKPLRSVYAINMNGGLRGAVRGAEMIQHSGSSSRGRALWEVGTNNHVLQGIRALREAFKEF